MWAKQHSQNAVAAKARKRLAAASAEPAPARRRVPVPSRARADFIIRIESSRGERLQVSAWRFNGRVRLSTGDSVRHFCRGLEHLLTKSA